MSILHEKILKLQAGKDHDIPNDLGDFIKGKSLQH